MYFNKLDSLRNVAFLLAFCQHSFSRKFYIDHFADPPSDFSLDFFLLLEAKKLKQLIFFHNRKFRESKGVETIEG